MDLAINWLYKFLRFCQRKQKILIITLLWLGLGKPVQAQITPNGLGTQVERSGKTINITGGKRGGNNLFHSFGQFNVQTGETANFWSNPAITNILARVNGGSPSYINGLIQVLGGNSNLFLLNPSGIIFGANAALNVPAAFVASTANRVTFPNGIFDMTTQNVEGLTGNPLALMDLGNSKIEINGAKLSAPGGITLAAGGGLLVDGAKITTDRGITLVGRRDGFVEIRTEGNILGFEVRRDELQNATSIYQLPELLTGNGRLTVRNSEIQGQSAQLLGREIVIQLSTIDVSQPGGGGTIHIGGDYQGKGLRPNAENVFVDSASKIRADALGIGNGGTIIVWADKATGFGGQAFAKAGESYGNGGFIEISGKEQLAFAGKVDVTAPQGQVGTLLLDPTNITISSAPTTAIFFNPLSNTFENSLSGANINVNDLVTNLATANITITTASLLAEDGTISINDSIIYTGIFDRQLTLLANKDIQTAPGISIKSTVGKLDLNFQATGNILISNGTQIDSNAGNITFTANTGITQNGTVESSSGNITFTASTGSIAQNGTVESSSGNITFTANTGIAQNGTVESSSGNITFTANTGSITQNGTVESSSGNITFTANTGSITQNGTVESNSGNISLFGFNKIEVGASGLVKTNSGQIDISTKELKLNGGTPILTQGGNIQGILLKLDGSGATINSNGGHIKINDIALAPANSLYPHGLDISNATIISGSGQIVLKGQGLNSHTGSATGVRLDNVQLQGDNIKVKGQGGNFTTGDVSGISINNSTLTGKNLTLEGTGGNAGSLNSGVKVTGGSIGFTQNVNIQGTSPTALGENYDLNTPINAGNNVTLTGNSPRNSTIKQSITANNLIINENLPGSIVTADAIINLNNQYIVNSAKVKDTANSSFQTPNLSVNGSGTVEFNQGTHFVDNLSSTSAEDIKLKNNTSLNLGNNNITNSLEIDNNGNSINQLPSTTVIAGKAGLVTNGSTITLTDAQIGTLATNSDTLDITLNSPTTIGSVGATTGLVANTQAQINTNSIINQTKSIDTNKLISNGSGTFNLNHPDNIIGEINGSFASLDYTSAKSINPLVLKNINGNSLSVNILDNVNDQGNVNLTNYSISTSKNILRSGGGLTSAGALNWQGSTIQQNPGSPLSATTADFTVTTPGDVKAFATSSLNLLPSQADGNFDLIVNPGNVTQSGTLQVAGKTNISATGSVTVPNIISNDITLISNNNIKITKIGSISVGALSGYSHVTLTSLSSGTGFSANSAGTPAISLLDPNNSFLGNVGFTTPIGTPTSLTGVSQVTTGNISVAGNVVIQADTINVGAVTGNTLNATGQAIVTGNLTTSGQLKIVGNTLATTGNLISTSSTVDVKTTGDTDVSGYISGNIVLLDGANIRVHGVDGNGNSIDGNAVTITHDGNGIVPFIVGGGSAVNGTAGKIANGGIPLGSYLYSFSAGNHSIITGGTPPTPGGGSNSLTPTPPEPNNPENNLVLLREIKLLPIANLLSPIETISAIDQSFALKYGLSGFEPENDIGSIAQLQKEVLDQAAEQGRGRAALLYWWWRDGQLVLGVIVPRKVSGEQSVFVKSVQTNQAEVQKTIEAFLFAIKDPRQRNSQSYRPYAQKLYSWLVSPIKQILESNQIETIIIVPDEKFRTIPYRALWSGQEYFIEQYRLVQIPSINLANFDLTSNSLTGNMVAMGAETFNGQQAPLPAVPIELQQVAEINKGKMKLNEEFKFSDFLQTWRQNLQGGIHLATHADFSAAQSYIQFWDRPVNLQELREHLNTTRSELVVLSACRTSIGDAYAELGFSGLAVRLGAKRAVASLWYVEDEATMALMNEFYRRLQANALIPIQSEALRQAQISMIRGNSRIESKQLVGDGYQIPLPPALRQDNRTFAHPYYWAGFNMIGNPW